MLQHIVGQLKIQNFSVYIVESLGGLFVGNDHRHMMEVKPLACTFDCLDTITLCFVVCGACPIFRLDCAACMAVIAVHHDD